MGRKGALLRNESDAELLKIGARGKEEEGEEEGG